jgi:branched-chain amino acid transport system ATP-binding protein
LNEPPALEVKDLSVHYRKAQVVFGADVSVRRGETVAALGRNGAGKTSLLHGIAGIATAQSRQIRLHGEDVATLPAFRRSRAGLALVPSGARVFPNLTVEENLKLVATSKDRGPWTIANVYERFPALAERRHSRGEQLSGGERQMLAVGRALMANPRVLMLDEPSAGLAPLIVRELGEMLRELNSDGLTVLLTEQNHRMALETAERVYFIEKGHIMWEGTSDEAADPEVIGRYLGV